MALFDKNDLEKLKRGANELLNRTIDQHVKLAVTGLSRSGKTAFITSLVNQLVNENEHSELHFFNPVHQSRFIAAKRVPQQHLYIKRFDYEKCLAAFTQHPPSWPEPTNGISELRLAIKYQPKNSLLKYATDSATLYVDITDYPGEWLLDLPMLNQTFEQWSEAMLALLEKAPRVEHSADFLEKVAQLDPFAPIDEEYLSDLAQEYTQLLHYFKDTLGLSIIQPGRFILPGELAGAPILQFFPYSGFKTIDLNQYQNAADDSLIGMLRARFIEYKERVVRKFYREHFVNFDRQIVLADCLTPLNQGRECFADLQQGIEMIMENFNYGKSNLLSRLFSPKISKLLFAATKADHVTSDQHDNLTAFLNMLVFNSKQNLKFNNIEMNTLAIASVKSTQSGEAVHHGKKIPVIQGRALDNQQLMTLFPGQVPRALPDDAFWEKTPFNFVAFAPKEPITMEQPLAHIRIDQVLQFLLGDKMK